MISLRECHINRTRRRSTLFAFGGVALDEGLRDIAFTSSVENAKISFQTVP